MRLSASVSHPKFYCSSLLAACAVFAAGCSSLPIATTSDDPSADELEGDFEKLQPGDLLKITFKGPINLTIPVHEERIPEGGYVTLPDIGKVEAVGKTRIQLQEAIHDKYVPSVYKELAVTIEPGERFFYTSGEVKEPNRHPYLGKLTLTKAISASGGLTDFADKSNVTVTRGKGRVLRAHYGKAIKNPAMYDIKIFPGDDIHVPRRNF